MEKTKQLLDRFYSGESTPDENRLIASLLSEDDEGDKALFDALAEAELDTAVPQELEANIRQAITKTPRRKVITLPVWLKAGGIAAAIAVLAIGWVHLNDSDDIPQVPDLIAEIPKLPVVTSSSVPKEVIVVTDQSSQPAEVARPTDRKPAVRVPTEDELLEAEASLRLLGEKLNEGVNKAASAVEQLENNKSLKNILK